VVLLFGAAFRSDSKGGAEAPAVWDAARRKPSEQRAVQAEAPHRDDCELSKACAIDPPILPLHQNNERISDRISARVF